MEETHDTPERRSYLVEPCWASPYPLSRNLVPAPGASPRIDAIKKAGVLRVAVLANAPWLVENTTGSGDHWSGSLPGRCRRNTLFSLGVKLDLVLVSA